MKLICVGAMAITEKAGKTIGATIVYYGKLEEMMIPLLTSQPELKPEMPVGKQAKPTSFWEGFWPKNWKGKNE